MAGGQDKQPGRSVALHVLAAVVLLAGAVFSVVSAVGQTSRIEAARADAHRLELLAVRSDLARSHNHEVFVRSAEVLGLADAEEVNSAAKDRIAALTRGLADLQRLVDQSTGVGDHAETVLDVYRDEAARGEPDVFDLFTAAQVFQWEGQFPGQAEDPTGALEDAAWLDDAATYTRHEVLVALFSRSGMPVEDDVSNFLADEAQYIASSPGGFVGDGRAPLDSSWIEVDRVREFEPELLGAVNGLLVDSSVVEMNAWLETWVDGPLPEPPVAPSRFVADTAAVVDDIRELIDGRLSAALAERRSTVDTHMSRRTRSWTSAVMAGAGFLGVLWSLTWRLRSRSRLLEVQANTDPLTGIGNRNVLASRTAGYLSEPRWAHHLVVTIDMDRFKVANDTFGHATGDRILVTLARGLVDLTESFSGASTVVRLGGDEFFLSLHAELPIDAGWVRSQLDALRSRSIATDTGANVGIDFSYGVVVASGSPDLAELLDASDLAAYEQKADRHRARQATEAHARHEVR